ncbi:MAG: VWA domain-containing protein [Phycisphaerales bacterium]|nr:VWA domain-containing protein [Phycisphaerales bacterium]
MKDFAIDNIEQLYWLWLALAVGAVSMYGFSMKRRALRDFASMNLLDYLVPNLSWTRRYFKAGLVLAAMVALIVALTGPRWGTYREQVHRRQLDLMVCLDVSKSMLAEDAGMSRLDRAKDDINRLLDKLGGATIGLVTFAGEAEPACPLTDDYEYYRLALEDVGLHSAPLGGTNLGDALATARHAFGEPRPRDRAILLITDGEDHGGTAVDEALKARKDNIIVYTIGIGDDAQGALIPMKKGQQSFVKYDGQQVWSRMDPTRLQAVARAGGGEYHPSGQVTATQRTLEWIYAQKLLPLQRRAETERKVEKQHVRFHWFAVMALILLMLETLISERRSNNASLERELRSVSP